MHTQGGPGNDRPPLGTDGNLWLRLSRLMHLGDPQWCMIPMLLTIHSVISALVPVNHLIGARSTVQLGMEHHRKWSNVGRSALSEVVK
jgi:hypothetical protein